MACKILFFDCKDSEKPFFKKNQLENFCIKLVNSNLDRNTVKSLSEDDFSQTLAISVNEDSNIDETVIENFKNLRVIATRSKTYDHIDLQTCIKRNIAVINVETYKPDCEFHNLNVTFKGITAVLCGGKEYRVV